MKYLLSIIIIFCGTVLSVPHRTTAFLENWNTNNNKDSMFYDNKTFGIDIYDDPCEKVTGTKFRRYVNKMISCTGKWCTNERFDTQKSSIRNEAKYYEVEHIIDTGGSEFTASYCKEIAGNVVMAYSSWNRGLGGISSKHGYKTSMEEKTIVYGEINMERVRKIILDCNQECLKLSINTDSTTVPSSITFSTIPPSTSPSLTPSLTDSSTPSLTVSLTPTPSDILDSIEEKLNPTTSDNLIVILELMSIIIIFILLCYFIYKCKNRRRHVPLNRGVWI